MIPLIEASDRVDQEIKILVVDDNFFATIAVISVLHQYQLDCDHATDGKEAFEMVKKLFDETG